MTPLKPRTRPWTKYVYFGNLLTSAIVKRAPAIKSISESIPTEGSTGCCIARCNNEAMTIIEDVRDRLVRLSDLDPLPINARLKLLAPVALTASFVVMAIAVQASGDDCIEIRNPQAMMSNRQLAYLSMIHEPMPINMVQQEVGTPLCRLNNSWLSNITPEDTSYPSERLAYPLDSDPNAWVVLHVLAHTGDVYGFGIQRAGYR